MAVAAGRVMAAFHHENDDGDEEEHRDHQLAHPSDSI